MAGINDIAEIPREQLEAQLSWYRKTYGEPIMRRGLHNWKNLYKKKPTLQDWIILFMIIMSLFISWAYQRDITICREYIAEQEAQVIRPSETTAHANISLEEIQKSGYRQSDNP